MAQSGKGKLNFRCPNCFNRDIDMDMFYDKEKNEYYCLRCQYTGTEKEVREAYEDIRKKYRELHKRFTKFDFD